MKKKIVWSMAALLAAACALFFAGRTAKPKALERIEPMPGRDFMRASLTYDEALRTLRGTQTIEAENRTGVDLSEIVLRAYINGWDGCSAQLSGMKVNGKIVSFSQDDDDPTVLKIDYSWRAGEKIVLDWTVMIKHAKTSGAAVILLPCFAMIEDGAWRMDAYDDLADPSFAQPFDFMVELDGEAVACGRLARDAGFAMGSVIKEREVSGVRIRAIAQNTGIANTLLAQSEAALQSLNDAGLAYPGDVLTVVDSGSGSGAALALSWLIAVDGNADKETQLRTMTRLIARQTFGIFVENDPWNAPWLSETLASCAEMLAFRERKGAAAYEERLYGEMELATRITRPVGVSVGAGTAHFGSESEMEQVLRDEGAAMLLGIEQAVGSEAFVTALGIYAGDNAGAMGTLEALCKAFEQATGSSWAGYIADML